MKKVLVFGSFDLIHKGHLYFLENAKKQGDELIVVVARDNTIEKFKKHKPKYSEDMGVNHIKEIEFVDKVVLGHLNDKYKAIEEIKPEMIVLGYDQNSFTDKLESELNKRKLKIEIIRLNSYKPEIYKSSKLKKYIEI